jgi:hypothetical protein
LAHLLRQHLHRNVGKGHEPGVIRQKAVKAIFDGDSEMQGIREAISCAAGRLGTDTATGVTSTLYLREAQVTS